MRDQNDIDLRLRATVPGCALSRLSGGLKTAQSSSYASTPTTASEWMRTHYGYPSSAPLATNPHIPPGSYRIRDEAPRLGLLGAATGLGVGGIIRLIRTLRGKKVTGYSDLLLPTLIGGGVGVAVGAGTGAESTAPKDRDNPRRNSYERLGRMYDARQGLGKQSQMWSGSSLGGRTLYDLYREIRADGGLSEFEKQRLINQVEGVTRGSPPGTPLGVLMAQGLGGTIGWLISKYFGMSTVGKVVSSLMGAGLGRKLYDQYNKPPPEAPGWNIIR